MTVEVETARVSYTGAGTTGPFTIPFYFLENADIRAIKVTIADGTEDELALTTDFTLTGAGEEAGGELTLVASLSSSFKLIIFRDPDVLQESRYPRNDPFPSATHEEGADRLTMIAQRHADLISRSIRMPDGDYSGVSMVIPAVVSRASMVLGFDADGAVAVYEPESAVTSAANVTFTQSGITAINQYSRSVQEKLGEGWISVKDAKNTGGVQVAGDGSTDDTTGIQAALNTGKDVFFPGVDDPTTEYYKLTAALSLLDNQRIFGEGARSIIRQTTANANVINITGKDYAAVENLRLYCVGSKNSISNGCGVFISASSTKCSVRNNVIENHRGNGVCIENSTDNIVEGNFFQSSPVLDSDDHTQAGADVSIQYASPRNIVRGNICASGQGLGIQVQTITSGDNADDNVIVGNIVRDCRIYGIMVYKTNSGDSLTYSIIANNSVRNVSGAIENASDGFVYGTGIYVQGAEETVVDSNNVTNTHSAAVTFVDQLGPGGIGAINVSRVSITNNRVHTCGMFGITVRDNSGTGAADGYAIVGNNDVRDTAKDGIQVVERGRIKIIGNTVDDTTLRGIYIKNTTAKDLGVSIVGNDVKNSTSSGIEVDFCDSPVVANNHSRTAGVHGITLANCDDAAVTGNTVNDHVTRGIQVTSTCARCLVDGNTVRGDGTSAEGIRLSALTRIGINQVSNCVTNWVDTFAVLRGAPNVTPVGNVGTGEDNLITYSIPAATLTATGQGIVGRAWGTTANNADAKTLKFYIGATAVLTVSLTVSQLSPWVIEFGVYRSGVDAQRYEVTFSQGGTTKQADFVQGNLTEDDGAAIVIKCTGEATSNNDIVQNGLIAKYVDN